MWQAWCLFVMIAGAAPAEPPTALHGELNLLVSAQGHVQGRLFTHVPKGQTSLEFYPAALAEPYIGNDVDRLWDYPSDPEGTNARMELRQAGAVVSAAELMPGPLEIQFSYDIPLRYGALGRDSNGWWVTAGAPFVAIASHAVMVEWSVRITDPSGTEQRTYTGAPERFFFAWAQRGLRTEKLITRFTPEPRHFATRNDDGTKEEYTPQPQLFAWLDFTAKDELADAAAWVGSVIERHHAKALPWLVVPLRRQIAECAGNVVLVSREAFAVTPLEDVQKFHRLGLARTALSCAFEHDFFLDPESADALAIFVLERQQREVAEGSRDPKELLKYFRFIPDIDSLLYAPQMPLAATYFSALDETEHGPATPGKFFHHRPQGKLFFEKLRDRIGDANTDDLFARALTQKRSPIALAEHQYPHDALIIKEDFFGPYPKTDLGFIIDDTTVVIEKRGEPAREPLTVEIEDGAGKVLRQTSEEARIAFVDATAPIQRVELDPDRRQVELLLPDNAHPRFDDSTHHGVRLVLTRLIAGLGFSGAEVSAGIDFALRREWDLNHRLGFGAQYDPSSAGGSVRYSYSFGPRVTADSLAMSWSTGVSFERLTQGFAGATQPYWLASASTSFVYDDRPALRTAMQGQAALAYAGVGVPFDYSTFGYGGAGLMKFFRTRHDQALAVRTRFDAVIGVAPSQALYSLGGRSQARGYALGEITVRNRWLVSAEYRHEIARGFRANFADLVWIDGIEGALFADLAFAHNQIENLFSRDAIFGDVGYGIRILYDQLGVNPGVLTLDFGIPLRRARRDLPPVAVFIGFVQSFSDF